MASVWIAYARAVKEFGWRGVYEKCTSMGTVKMGTLIGTDKMGNKYYEDRKEQYGQHRWVEYKDIWNYDATMVPPSWHGWLHHMHDEPGHVLEQAAIEQAEKFGVQLDSSDDGIYSNHIGYTTYEEELMHNKTGFRQRGYKIGSLYTKAGEPDQYYRQPGTAASYENLDYKHVVGVEIAEPGAKLEDTKVRPLRSHFEI